MTEPIEEEDSSNEVQQDLNLEFLTDEQALPATQDDVNYGIHDLLDQQNEAQHAAKGLELALTQGNAKHPIFAQFANAVTVGQPSLAASLWNEMGGDNKAWPFMTVEDARESFANSAAALETLQSVQQYLEYWAQRQLADAERIAEWFAANSNNAVTRDEKGRFTGARRVKAASEEAPRVTGAPQRVPRQRPFGGGARRITK